MPVGKNNPISRRHHFVPQFYLKAWKNPDGKGLWIYARDKRNCVKAYRRSPKSVAYVTDLYALEPETPYPVLDHPQDAIEKGFFAPIDDAAAIVHQKLLESGVRYLTEKDRVLWALFLNSLIERSPSRIKLLEQFDSMESIRNELVQRWGNPEFLAKIHLSAMCRNSVRRALVNYIKDGPFINYVAGMRWATVDIGIDGEHLVTGDKPLLVNGGAAGYPVHCLSIALSPHRLLVIHSNSDEFDESFIKRLAVIHNIAVIQQIEQYAVSSRQLIDGPHTMYSRVVRELLKKSNTSW